MAVGDGRYDSTRLIKAVEQHSHARLLVDMEALAKESGAMINAVMLGLIAGAGRLPIALDGFEAAIRADGKAVETNLRGFRAGIEAAQRANVARASGSMDQRDQAAPSPLAELEHAIVATMPATARDVILQGARRLVPYQ